MRKAKIEAAIRVAMAEFGYEPYAIEGSTGPIGRIADAVIESDVPEPLADGPVLTAPKPNGWTMRDEIAVRLAAGALADPNIDAETAVRIGYDGADEVFRIRAARS